MSISIDAAVLAMGAAALAVSRWTGLLRLRGVCGPDRMAGEPASTLAMIALATLAVWLIVPGLFAPAANSASTTPVSESTLSPAQTVVVGASSAAAGIVVMLVGNAAARPAGLRRLGLSVPLLGRGLVGGALGALLLIPVTFASTVLTQWLWNALGIEHPGAHELLTILGSDARPGLRSLIVVSAIVLAPAYEEIFFRGHVQTLLVGAFEKLLHEKRATARWLAIVVAAGFFAIVHPPWMAPPIFVLAVGLGYAYERTGNLWTPIVMHALFNFVSVVLFLGQT
jgi:membrane protease YdiL (CAAX protease family)